MIGKYLVTLMSKHELEGKERLFEPLSTTTGDIDEKTNIFTSFDGKKYKRITDFSPNKEGEDIAGYYCSEVEFDAVAKVLDVKSHTAALMKYERLSKDRVFLVAIVGGSAVIREFSRSACVDLIEKAQKEGEPASPTSHMDECTIDEDADDYDPTESISYTIKDLIRRISEGAFSPDELLDLKESMEEVQTDVETALETLNLQSDAIETEMADKVAQYDKKHNPQAVAIKSQVPTPTAIKDAPSVDLNSPINTREIFEKVTKTLVAQDKGARRMINEISRLIDSKKRDYGILLTGDTGVGKTLLMRLISENLGRPFIKIDSTQLTAPAYAGRSIEQYLWELYESCGRNKDLAEQAIIYFDEADKKGSERKDDPKGQAVIDTFLCFIEGTDYIACKNPQVVNDATSVKLNTSNMTPVFGGAFLSVYQRKHKPKIGFSQNPEEEEQAKNRLLNPTPEDFVKYGNMPSEFMGRVPIIIHLDDLTIDSIESIILKSDDSFLTRQEEVFLNRGVKLTTLSGYITAIAEDIYNRHIGARGIASLIADTTAHAYDTICEEPGAYEEVILTEETAKDPSAYQLVKKNQQKKS